MTRRMSLVGGLRVQRRGQLAVARLQLGQQARVLDRDHGLVGERLEQRDLVVGERRRLAASHRDAPIASSWRSSGTPAALR